MINPSSKQILKDSNQDKKTVCNGFHCSEIATILITESVGYLGEIELELCDNCLRKFRYNKTVS